MFYAFENDIILLPIIMNEFYLGFRLNSISKDKILDNLNGIVGGIGISQIHEHKRHMSEPRNSILLRCKSSNLNQCFKNCYIVAYWVKNRNMNDININQFKNEIKLLSSKGTSCVAFFNICSYITCFECTYKYKICRLMFEFHCAIIFVYNYI